MHTDTHVYVMCSSLDLNSHYIFCYSVEGALRGEDYRAVIRFLYLNNHTPQETFESTKAT